MSQQQPTAERYKFNLGSLRSEIELTLHTYHAVRVWQGGQPTGKEGYTVPGMQMFFSVTNLIKMSSARDNPYADWWMIRIEEKLDDAQQEMSELSTMLDKLIAVVPEQISITDNLNQKPFSTPLFCNSHMGFRAVFLLEAYDALARKILLANHVGLLSRRDLEGFLDQGAHLLRSLFGLALTYRNAGVTRDDMRAKNARASKAVELLGMPPADILDGTRRSDFAPNIIRNASDNDEDFDEMPQHKSNIDEYELPQPESATPTATEATHIGTKQQE